jgi:hypothetical protein
VFPLDNYKDIYNLVRGEFKSFVTEADYSPAGATNVIYDDYCTDYQYDDLLNYWFLHSLLRVNSKAEYLRSHKKTDGKTLRKIIELIVKNPHSNEETKTSTKEIIDYLNTSKNVKAPKINLTDIVESEKKTEQPDEVAKFGVIEVESLADLFNQDFKRRVNE